MSQAPFVVGVVADTHVPDRLRNLPQALKDGLAKAGVQHILHCGDISTRRVLAELNELAPTSAVRGNRDFLFAGSLPESLELDLGGVRVGMLHGHGGMHNYWKDKLAFLLRGYQISRYAKLALEACPGARVIVFGHTHRPENLDWQGRLLFNPGAVTGFQLGPLRYPASYGLLRIGAAGQVEAEIIPLD